jgi:prephenate dehydrogenase
MTVKIIGCGLIGTSIALRLKELGEKVWVEDKSPANLALARDLIGNHESEPANFDLIIIATPISAIIDVLSNLKNFNENSTVIDIGGLKSKLILKVEDFKDIAPIFISAHPMAGREFVGPSNARADLFEGRAWLLTKTSQSNAKSVDIAKKLGRDLGATSYELSSKDHDSTIAAISHMPQVLSSLMGHLLNNESVDSLNFAGQGLRDVSRLADSDREMWSHLLLENSEEILPRINSAIDLLQKLHDDLSTNNEDGVDQFLAKGKAGRERIPGKHGAKPRTYSYLPIVIDDKPGQLARIFDECAQCSVNVEDLSIEHSPNQETGLITLALSQADALKLKAHMQSKGWLAQEIHS